jgi:hypothetical protein
MKANTTISKKDLYTKAVKINNQFVNLSTIKGNSSPEIVEICTKIRNRAKKSEITVRQFSDQLIINRLRQIAKNLPDEGYSMGSAVYASLVSKTVKSKYSSNPKTLLSIYDNRCLNYAKSCRYKKPTHGQVFLDLTIKELINTKVIANLVTYIYPNQKNKVQKCYWYVRSGYKSAFRLVKQEGFIFAGFHATTPEQAKAGGERNIQYQKEQAKKAENYTKALRLQYSFQDSLNAGNCEAGTRAFILRLGLNSTKKYRGAFLLSLAKEKSPNCVYHVERMINSKVRR